MSESFRRVLRTRWVHRSDLLLGHTYKPIGVLAKVTILRGSLGLTGARSLRMTPDGKRVV